MDRRSLAAIAAIGILAAGAWWLYRRNQAAGPELLGGPDPEPGAELLQGAGDAINQVAAWFAPALEPLQIAGEEITNVATDIANAIRPGAWQPPASAAPYLVLIEAAERAYGIPQNMLARLLYQESRYRQDIITGRTRSPAGALGIAQFMPATAAELGVDPLDPASAIDGAGRYLAGLYRQLGDWKLALAAYNWGIGNVKRKGLGAAPAETQSYVAGILGDLGYA